MDPKASDSFPFNQTMELNPLLTRHEMVGITGMAGLAALTGSAAVCCFVIKQP